MTDLFYDDIYNNIVLKSVDGHIIEFDITYRDRRKYNSLVDNIVQRGYWMILFVVLIHLIFFQTTLFLFYFI